MPKREKNVCEKFVNAVPKHNTAFKKCKKKASRKRKEVLELCHGSSGSVKFMSTRCATKKSGKKSVETTHTSVLSIEIMAC